MVRQNASGLQWIASEAWTVAAVLQTSELMPYLGGTLGIAIRRGEIPGLRDFLLGLHPGINENSNGRSLVIIRPMDKKIRQQLFLNLIKFATCFRLGSSGNTPSSVGLLQLLDVGWKMEACCALEMKNWRECKLNF